MTAISSIQALIKSVSGQSSEQAESKFSDQQIEKMKEEAIQTEMKVNGLSRKDAEEKVEHLF